MTVSDSDWRSMRTAPRDGTRILVTVRATEQGEAEVDVVKWATGAGSDAGWLATDSDPGARIVYGDGEIAAWMPLPSATPTHGGRTAPAPYDGEEIDGSAI